ncbi:MAG: ornithine cyclodeaminase family protein [Nocardioides sp.]
MSAVHVWDADAVRASVSMSRAIEVVREAFVGFGAGEFELPVRTALDDGKILVMSAFHRASGTAAVKTVSVDLDRRPAVQGTVSFVAASGATTVADAPSITALRTGAVVGVATDALAPADASHLVLIGLGGQAADQLRAIRAVRPIRSVTLVERDLTHAQEFRGTFADALDGLDVALSSDPDVAVRDADVVCCATPSRTPLFAADSLPEWAHVNAIGAFRPAMRELPDELLATAYVVVDQREAALEEAGEIIHALGAGSMTERDLTELSELLADPGRAPSGGRTVFKSVGLAIQDWAVARVLMEAIS